MVEEEEKRARDLPIRPYQSTFINVVLEQQNQTWRAYFVERPGINAYGEDIPSTLMQLAASYQEMYPEG